MATAVAHAAAATPLAASQSLLFQLEIDGRDVLRPQPPPPRRDLHAILDRLEAMCRPETNFEARLARDARYYHAATLEEEGRADVVILASRLAGVGYDVTIRTALGGGSGVSAFKHLSHEFLVVAGPPESLHYGGAAEYIVDPRFREQFDIPQTVAWYDELLVSVPEAFTGPPARLRALVRLLSGEMGAAFAAAGAVTPPWRSAGALLSKWLPAKARDKHISDPHHSSAGGSACSMPGSPDASQPPPSSSVPIAAGFGGAGFGGSAFNGAGAGIPRPTFATAGEDLRTTSAPAPAVAAASSAAAPTDAVAAGLSGSEQLAPPQQQHLGTAASGGVSSPAAQAQPPQPEGRSDSEDDHLSSPDTTLAWRMPSSSRRGAKAAAQQAAQPASAAAAQLAAGTAQQGQVSGPPPGAAAVAAAGQPQRRRMPRTISREELLAGSGGRSPPKAAAMAMATAPRGTTKLPPHIPSLRASSDGPAAGPAGAAVPQSVAQPAAAGSAAAQAWADASQYAAHPQTLPPPCHGTTSAPVVASAGSDASGGYVSGGGDDSNRARKVSGSLSDTAVDVKALNPDAKPSGRTSPQQPQLRTRSTSALSTKLASAGIISKRAGIAAVSAASAASSAAFSKAAFQPAAQPSAADSHSGGAAPPLHCGTGTLPAGSRLPTSPPDAAVPQPSASAAVVSKQQRPPSREPSVEAPFWDQPLIRNFIATQREQPLPPPPIKTRVGAAGAGADAYLQGEPRIRTVKMRGGAGVSTHHTPLRRPMHA